MAGLQGAGKTTTVAKLAQVPEGTQEEKGDGGQRRRLSSGRHRAAAHARRAGRRAVPSDSGDQDPVAIAKSALDAARKNFADVLIVDTAGRLAIDAADDGRDQGAARRAQSDRDAVRRRFDDRPGRGEHRQGIRRSAAAHRRDPDQDRRRRARRRGAVGALHHRPADQVHRRQRKARRPRRVPSRSHRAAHPRHGRRAVAGRAGRAEGRQGEGAEARREGHQGQALRSQRHARPARADA